MSLEIEIIVAILLDLAIGDPKWSYHPVRLIGRFAIYVETATRQVLGGTRTAGLVTALDTIAVTGLVCATFVEGAEVIHWLAGDLMSVVVFYFAFSARDLDEHASLVHRSLENDDIEGGRAAVGRLVGRDTENLDENEIVRATVESVAENMVDGVTAPLLFAIVGGPVGVMVYKAVNTMDSMFGHKNEKYIDFGWASAKLDDVANYIPARITAYLVVFSSALLEMNWLASLKTIERDGHKHSSPNSGLTESAFAGALEIQLGGQSFYDGVARDSAYIGKPTRPISAVAIVESIELMYTTLIVSALLLLFVNAVGSLFWW